MTRRFLMVASLALGLLLGALDQFVFATALPTIFGELGGLRSLLWVNTAYVLTGTVAMPVYGVLGARSAGDRSSWPPWSSSSSGPWPAGWPPACRP